MYAPAWRIVVGWCLRAGLTEDCAVIGWMIPTTEVVLSHTASPALINARGNNRKSFPAIIAERKGV